MQKSTSMQTSSNSVARSWIAAGLCASLVMAAHPAFAMAGLDSAQSWITSVQGFFGVVLPILAVISAAIIAVVEYWFGAFRGHGGVGKWIMGVIFIGCAGPLYMAIAGGYGGA